MYKRQVIQRQIKPVFEALSVVMVFVYVIICVGDRVLKRVVAETKVPFPVAVNAVEVNSRHSGRRHMRHIQATGNGVADFDPRSVTVEMNGKPCRCLLYTSRCV